MPDIEAVLEQCKWLISKGRGKEKGHLLLPEDQAQKRIENKKKSTRIVVVADEQSYKEFHALKEAWMRELDGNPTKFYHAMMIALQTFDVRGWKEQEEGPHGG